MSSMSLTSPTSLKKNRSIKSYMILIVSALTTLLFALAAISLYQISGVIGNIELMINDSYPKVKTVRNLMSEIDFIELNIRNAITKLQVTGFSKNIESSYVKIDEDLAFLEKTLKAEYAKQIIVEFKSNYGKWKKDISNLLNMVENVQVTEAQQMLYSDQFSLLENKLRESTKLLINFQEERLSRDYESAQNMYSNSKLSILIATSLCLIFAILSIFYTIRVLNRMSTSILDSIKSIINSSSEISSGNQNLATRTEEASSSLQETTSTLQELTATINQTAANAAKVLEIVESSVQGFNEGKELSAKVKTKMSEINNCSAKIAEIVGMVQEIAFQTNILAINAAIEAAKAGELGQGFAVVAIEVRDLAQRSQEAAKEIKQLIENSVQTISQGTMLVAKNDEKINHIVQGSKRVLELVTEVATASKEQTGAIAQIGSSISELDKVTQQNFGLVEQVSCSGEKMKSETEQIFESLKSYMA
ncbi:MAG: MCP four helix bundle domain-containing protein [Oligoflexia bacterium]|nr:MCP four helix bundle domain-containing protein [Oligoflexia bacterium]